MMTKKKAIPLGLVGASITGAGWGLYADAVSNDKTEELSLQIQELKDENEQVQEELYDTKLIKDNQSELLKEVIKHPLSELVFEQKAEILKLTNKIKELKRYIDGYEDLLLQVEEGNLDSPWLKDLLGNKDRLINRLHKDIEDLEAETELREKWVTQLENRVNSQQQDISELKSELKAERDYSAKLDEYIDDMENSVQLAATRNLLSQIQHLQRTELNLQDYINQLQTDNDKLKAEVTYWDGLIQNRDTTINTLLDKVDKLQDDLDFQKSIVTHHQTIDDYRLQEISTLQELVGELTDELKEAKAENEVISKEFQDLSIKVAEIEW